MGCIKVSIKNLGGIFCRTLFTKNLDTFVTSKTGISVSTTPLNSIGAHVKPKSGIYCRVYQVCTVNLGKKYLSINPTIVWVVAGYTQNDVFSNTSWNIH